jgi:signal transduction histidine kinase/ActR/RegA family two-component response regulator
LLSAWLEQSSDLLALTERDGTLAWANAGFRAATGLAPGAPLLALAPDEPPWTLAHRALQGALEAGTLADADLEVRSTGGGSVWVRARARECEGRLLWTLQDTTATRKLAAQARRQTELLDMAQEFGRLGVWERDIPSGKGHWDRHVFGFWGLEPRVGTPTYEEAIQHIHPDDRALMRYSESTRAAGRYAQRYRVLRPDGSTRWIHSQWEVKNSAEGRPERAIGIMVDDTVVYNSARALGEANAQLELAVELGRIAIWRQDLKTGRIHYNERGFHLLDIPARADGVPVAELHATIHPDDLPQVLAATERALHADAPTDTEARYRRAGGGWRYVLTRSVVQRAASGDPLALIGVALDVTDRVDRLRASEELARRLESAARAARVGIWTTTVTTDETDWNAQMFEIFDWPKERPPPSLEAFVDACVHPSERARVGAIARDYLVHGDGPIEAEFQSVRRDGSTRWIVLRADIDRVRTDRRRLLGVALDVTEHHEALAALREASERATLITRHAGIGTWESDFGDGSERWDEQMFQLRDLAPRPRPLNRAERLSLVHPEDLNRVLDMRAPGDLSPGAYEFRVRLPDGSWRWLASRSAVVRDDHGRPLRRVGVNWDITESKDAEAARQQAALAEREIQAKSQFLSRMSHELRTPLNAVLGFTQLLQIEASQADAPGQVAKLGHIRSAGEHLLALINDVLDLSNLESGELRLQPQPLDLGALVEQTLPLVEPLAAQQEVRLSFAPGGGTAVADPKRMRQVLINLFSNAIKYNRRGGEVLIETRADGENVHLSVRDTGRGLRPDQLAHLFEPFNRLGIEYEGIEGTGIGLTIVKALVEGMGGSIAVSSKARRGTVFEVTLPASAAAPATTVPTAAEPALPKAVPGGRHGQILYIEDNAVNVMLVEELVKGLTGLSFASEPTGGEGVARAKTLRPDLILVDLQLPDFDGYEVLRRLRAQPETAHITCIALSANAMPDDIARGRAAGFADYWTKPIDFKVFLAALDRLFPAPAVVAE